MMNKYCYQVLFLFLFMLFTVSINAQDKQLVLLGKDAGTLSIVKKSLTTSEKVENDYGLAVAYLTREKTDKAKRILINILQKNPQHNASVVLLSGIYISENRLENAKKILKKSLGLFPSNRELVNVYAHILFKNKEVKKAIMFLEEQKTVARKEYEMSALLAALYQKNNQHEQAIDIYRSLLESNANNGKWWLGLAISLEATNNLKFAKQAFELSLKAKNYPDSVTHYVNQRLAKYQSMENLE